MNQRALLCLCSTVVYILVTVCRHFKMQTNSGVVVIICLEHRERKPITGLWGWVPGAGSLGLGPWSASASKQADFISIKNNTQ